MTLRVAGFLELTFLSAVVLVGLIPEPASGQVIAAPVEKNGFAALTSYDELRGFLLSLDDPPQLQTTLISRSREGREVIGVEVGDPFGGDTTRLRIMLFAQQHGDEPSGKEALAMFLAGCASGEYAEVLRRVDLVVIPQMNPDGAELRQRHTSDIVRGLHSRFLEWVPEVTVDIHEFSSLTEPWMDAGIVKTGDVQLGLLSNLNCSDLIRDFQKRRVLPFLASFMKEGGYSFHEYIVGSPATRIRLSTTEINDGRQSFGIFNTMSFIQEGRTWSTLEDQLERRARSQLAAVEGLVRFCADHAAEIQSLVRFERERLRNRAGGPFVSIMDYEEDGRIFQVPVLDLETGQERDWSVVPFHGAVRAHATRSLPLAYMVPRELTDILDLLSMHGVVMDTVRRVVSMPGEVFYIDSLTTVVLQDQPHLRVWGQGHIRRVVLRPGDVVVTLRQVHSLFIATLLEAESMWGVSRYERFQNIFQGTHYPVVRLPVVP
jgi:hypothetical protein